MVCRFCDRSKTAILCSASSSSQSTVTLAAPASSCPHPNTTVRVTARNSGKTHKPEEENHEARSPRFSQTGDCKQQALTVSVSRKSFAVMARRIFGASADRLRSHIFGYPPPRTQQFHRQRRPPPRPPSSASRTPPPLRPKSVLPLQDPPPTFPSHLDTLHRINRPLFPPLLF